MKPLDSLLAIQVAVIWGGAFVATKIGLDSFSPPELTAFRFLIAAVPVVWLRRPAVSWLLLAATGLTLFAGQFLLQFFGIVRGISPGLAAAIVQAQVFFTVLLAALMLGDRPTGRQFTGMAVALAGLVLIGLTVGQGLTATGFGLALASAVSWSIGNVLVKRMSTMDMLPLVIWLSLVPPLPSLALASALAGPTAVLQSLAGASWGGIGAALYLGLLATVVAYAIWGSLLQRYPAAAVTPFALLAPCVGATASALVFGERFGPLRLAGIGAMLLGLAIVALPLESVFVPRMRDEQP